MQEPLCSWDSAIDERYNDYTTGNTEEVLPGITRPLPADLIREWDNRWHRLAVREWGTEDLVPIPVPPGPTMLPIVAGQWLVNIGMVNAFTSTFETGGSADYLKQFLAEGEATTASGPADMERAIATRAKLEALWDVAEHNIAGDEERSRAAYAATLARDWPTASDGELIAAVDDTTELCGQMFFTHYWASTGGGQSTTFLGSLLDEHAPGHPEGWTNALASGITGVESARPAMAIWDLSRFASARPALAAELPTLSADEMQERLASPPTEDWAAFGQEYQAFIDDLGFRGQRETDPSCATWNEEPNFVLSTIRADLAASDDRDPHVLEARRAEEREALEAEVEAALPAEAHVEFRRLAKASQVLNRAREGTKANWARACRNYRLPVLELGRRLVERGVIGERDDVWFLRLPELRAAAGAALSADEAKPAIESRKAEYAALWDYELPVIFARPIEATRRETPVASGETSFQAAGVSPGKARGRARVILSADAAAEATLLPGEILVAPFTDAPWTPLFIAAAGVVVETGGILSHAATVAREYGIPAVAGIRGATTLIPDGTMLSIDGAAGTVTIEPE